MGEREDIWSRGVSLFGEKETEKRDHIVPHSRICILFEVWSKLRSKDHEPLRGVVINLFRSPRYVSEPTHNAGSIALKSVKLCELVSDISKHDATLLTGVKNDSATKRARALSCKMVSYFR